MQGTRGTNSKTLGAWEKGDIVYDNNYVGWVCKNSGSPGTWESYISNTPSSISSSIETERLKTETHVFILAGQSNAVGRCEFDGGEDYPTGVMQYDRNGNIIQAVSPLDHHDEQAGTMGLSVSFAIEYHKIFPNVTLVFVPQAKGGSSYSGGNWNKGDFYYEDLVSRVNTLAAAHPDWKFKGMLWHQGEDDADSQAEADAFQSALDAGMTNFKNDIPVWDDNFKVILGGILPAWVDGHPERVQVQHILEDTPNRLSNFYFASSEAPTELKDKGDGLHYNADSQRRFGKRYLAQYLNAIGFSSKVNDIQENVDAGVMALQNIRPPEENYTAHVHTLEPETTAIAITTTNYQAPLVVYSDGGGWAPASQAFVSRGSSGRGAGTYYRNKPNGNNWFVGMPYENNDKIVFSYNNSAYIDMAIAQMSYARFSVDSSGNMGIYGATTQKPLSADPADPADGETVQWVSDGTGSGDAGDVMMKINVGGTTKVTTLVDYSGL